MASVTQRRGIGRGIDGDGRAAPASEPRGPRVPRGFADREALVAGAGAELGQLGPDGVDGDREADVRRSDAAAARGDGRVDAHDVPCAFTSGPPELPLLMAASVWTRPERVLPSLVWIERFSADTMPRVTVGPPSSARALPIATTSSPTARLDEWPSVAAVRPDALRAAAARGRPRCRCPRRWPGGSARAVTSIEVALTDVGVRQHLTVGGDHHATPRSRVGAAGCATTPASTVGALDGAHDGHDRGLDLRGHRGDVERAPEKVSLARFTVTFEVVAWCSDALCPANQPPAVPPNRASTATRTRRATADATLRRGPAAAPRPASPGVGGHAGGPDAAGGFGGPTGGPGGGAPWGKGALPWGWPGRLRAPATSRGAGRSHGRRRCRAVRPPGGAGIGGGPCSARRRGP